MFSLIGIIVGAFILGGGFWGGVLGFFTGSFIDNYIKRKKRFHQQHHYKKDRFTEILLSLAAYVIKVDGVVKDTELKYVTKHLFQNYSPETAQQLYQMLHNFIENNIDIEDICQDLYRNATVHEKLYIIQFLLGLVSSDGLFQQKELNVIQQISDRIGVKRSDFESIKAMFFMFNQGGAYYARGYQYSSGSQSYSGTYSSGGYTSNYGRTFDNLENEYNILEISPTATDDEVKKAYRRLAQKYHPDKVNHLGEEIRKDAETKFVRLNLAYERIKDKREMK